MTKPLPSEAPDVAIEWLAQLFDREQVLTWFDVEPDMLGMVFVPITFGALKGYSQEQIKSMCGFGLLEDAGPTSINGYPMFFRCYLWRWVDVVKAAKLAEAMAEAKQNVLAKARGEQR